MSYPGDGYRMSLYGRKASCPEEKAGQWKEHIQRENTIHSNHFAFKYVPKKEPETPDQPMDYFYHAKEHAPASKYDRMFHVTHGYNSRLHRDDRQHSMGLDILTEERVRPVAVLSSSEYGRHVHEPLEDNNVRKHVRIDRCVKGFYRSRGTGIPPDQE